MPFSTAAVGQSIAPIEHTVDARWLMAYAAGLGDFNPHYMDTQAGAVIGHPLFPVCLEWPVILNMRALAGTDALTPEEAARGVHAAHDLHIFRPIADGDRVTTQATLIGTRRIKPGAAYTLRLDTHCARSGDLLARTYQLGIYRDVDLLGDDAESEAAPPLPVVTDPAQGAAQAIHIPEGAAHTYTECARIWNPIHTDRAVALAAGLPDIILHGTATLALAVSHIVDRHAGGDPVRVRRLGGRFSAMVLMPSTISVNSHQQGNTVSFEVATEAGTPAISNGFVCLDRAG